MRWEIPAFALIGLLCGAILFFGSTEVSDVNGYRSSQKKSVVEKKPVTAEKKETVVSDKVKENEVPPRASGTLNRGGDSTRALVTEQDVSQLIGLTEKP